MSMSEGDKTMMAISIIAVSCLFFVTGLITGSWGVEIRYQKEAIARGYATYSLDKNEFMWNTITNK